MDKFSIEDRNKVKRVPKRAHYDQQTVYGILDAGFVCHISFTIDNQPFIIPTAFGREGNHIYLHGATKSRMLMALQKGGALALAVTHLDGIVMARSAFHSSMNYRSVVVFGKAVLVDDREEKLHGLKIISDHIVNGRWDELRPTRDNELKATTVLKMEIETASAKIREGGPIDEEDDMESQVWAGVIPLSVQTGALIADVALPEHIEPSSTLTAYQYPGIGD